MRRAWKWCATGLGTLVLAMPACGGDEVVQSTGGGGSTSSTSAAGTGGAGGTGAGDDSTTSTTSSTTTTSSATSGTGGGPSGCTPIATQGTVLALDTLLVGDTDPDGSPNSANGWKNYGFDLDGLVTSGSPTVECLPNSGANPMSVFADGPGGIDNSFGKNILPIFLALSPDVSAQANATIAAGQMTLLLHLTDLGAGADQAPILARLYGGVQTPAPPVWDGSDCWPMNPDSLTDPADPTTAKVVFDQSALANQVWSSGTVPTLRVQLAGGGLALDLVIHQARVSMSLDASHTHADAGQIAGVLDTEELVAQVTDLAGSFDPSLCSGPTIDSILAQVRQASDILADGTQDAQTMCNGISIGLGFKMSPVVLGEPGTAPLPPDDPCP